MKFLDRLVKEIKILDDDQEKLRPFSSDFNQPNIIRKD